MALVARLWHGKRWTCLVSAEILRKKGALTWG